MYLPLFGGGGGSVLAFVWVCFTLVVLFLLFSWCLVTVNVLWLFLAVPWVCLQCVIVVFSDHTHLLFHTLAVLSFKKSKVV